MDFVGRHLVGHVLGFLSGKRTDGGYAGHYQLAESRQNLTSILTQIISALGPLGQLLLSTLLSLATFGVIGGLHKKEEIIHLDRDEKECDHKPPPKKEKEPEVEHEYHHHQHQYETEPYYVPHMPHGLNDWKRKASYASYGRH